MNNQTKDRLRYLVNRQEWSAFIVYKESQVDKYHNELEWQTDEAFVRTQGKIQECRLDIDLMRKLNEN